MAAFLKYWNMPKAIQNKVDGAEFLTGVTRTKYEGKTAYRFHYEDSFEAWTRIYNGKGELIAESGYMDKGAMIC